MSRSALDDQMDWYHSQPPGYRRMWWEWASKEPNYREMFVAALMKEKDESVLRMMRIVDESMRAK